MFHQLKMRYLHFLSASPSPQCGESILVWLRDLDDYLEAAGRTAAPEDIETANMRVVSRLAIETLLRRLGWLGPEIRQALASVADKMPRYVEIGGCKFTLYYFLPHVLAWSRHLAHLRGKANVAALEIGSMEGASACWLLQNILTHSSCNLTCIDTFTLSGQSNALDIYEPGNLGAMRDLFEDNIRRVGRQQSVTIIAEPSQIALRRLPLSLYDFIYIDGSHMAIHVLQDAVLAWQSLKPGGVLTFDDFEWGEDEGLGRLCRPKPAIEAFLDIFSGRYELLDKGAQVTVLKICE
ncbi:MAG: class I SAM-dependent methyltransferase [Methylococcus sp.]|nr:class I SAM-dependent methyltransferase [Methylococcus sp.]